MAKENAEKQTITNRQRMVDRFKKSNPDFNGDDDEALYGAANDELASYDQMQEQRGKLNEALKSTKYAPEILAGLISKKNPDGSDFDLRDWLLANDDVVDYLQDYAQNGPDKAKARWADRSKQRKADEDAEAAFLKDKDAKVKKEDDELDAALKESNYKPEQVKDLISWIYDSKTGFIRRAANFELTKDDFIKLFRIKDYDVKMAESEDRGYKRGKNERIDMFEHKQQKRRNMPPDVGGGGGNAKPEKPKDSQMAALDRMKYAFG